jgi:hypothetical protein
MTAPWMSQRQWPLIDNDTWLSDAHDLVRETVASAAVVMPSTYESKSFQAFDRACAEAIRTRNTRWLSSACVGFLIRHGS